MERRKPNKSLTVRIFLITSLVIFSAVSLTFALIAFATPTTYTAVANQELGDQVDKLTEELGKTDFDESADLFDSFILSSGADILIMDKDGASVDVGSGLTGKALYDDSSTIVTSSGDDAVTWMTETDENDDRVTVTMSRQDTIAADIKFADRDEGYTVYVTPRIQAENMAVKALAQMAPWLFAVLLALSLLCAFIYSRYITRPIVRISGIAENMADLNFDRKCEETRRDEIGTLGRSLNRMSENLSQALAELKDSNNALQLELKKEREIERGRSAFFSAASHELKTPVTILKGQLSGMLDGIGVYKDRDKYLLRSLQVTGRMENLIGEMLSIVRMENEKMDIKTEPTELSEILKKELSMYDELIKQRKQKIKTDITPGITVTASPSLLGKAIGNLISNASLYSPEGAEIRLWCGRKDGRAAFIVENTGVHIREEDIPNIFEAFYREESSRNRSTGGSGLGLYITKIILKRHNALCVIKNTDEGVRAEVSFY